MEGLIIGAMVHYVLPETVARYDLKRGTWKEVPNVDCGKHRAAVVADVVNAEEGRVILFVFHSHSAPELVHGLTDTGADGVPYYEVHADGEAKPRTWHWIERT